jgi:hypothetical protein
LPTSNRSISSKTEDVLIQKKRFPQKRLVNNNNITTPWF